MRSLWWPLIAVNVGAALWAVYLLRYGDAIGVVFSLMMLVYALLNLLYVLVVRPDSTRDRN